MAFLSWRALVAVPMVLLGLAACSPSAPAIEDVSPHKGDGGVAGDAPIKVTFDRPMDRQSVSSRLKLDPALTGCTPSACPITWQDRTLVFSHPRNEFRADTRYTIHIKPGYRDSTGRVNTIEHIWEFRTETAPTLQSSNPGTDARAVAPDVDITLQFSRPMRTPTSEQLQLIDLASEAAPAVPYHASLDPGDLSRVVIAPVHLLRSRHRYRIVLTSDYQDARHNSLTRAVTLDFTTGDADLSRSLAFLVLDEGGASGSRIAVLRPPTTLGAPAPTLRVIYESTTPIIDFGWSYNARYLYTLEGAPAQLVRVDAATNSATPLGVEAAAMAVSPTRDEIAYVASDRSLHLWSPGAAGGAPNDLRVADAVALAGPPSWSGDGRRLALAIDAPDGPGLAVLDRATLSRFDVKGVRLALSGPDGRPRWSFDGAAVAFQRDVAGGPEVWTFRPLVAQGPGLTRIGKLHSAQLAWSSEGSTLYAAGDASAGQPRLLQRAPAQPLEGQAGGFAALRGSVPGDDMAATPAFDRRIAFVRAAGGLAQLWLINGDGTGLSQLTFAKYDTADKLPLFGAGLPRWAPGGAGTP
jgi:Tol biopolymer transport system component